MKQDCKKCLCNTCKRNVQCPMGDNEDRRYHCNILSGTTNKKDSLFTTGCPAYEKE